MVLWHFWAKPSAWQTVFVPPTNTHTTEAPDHRFGWCFTKEMKGWSGFLKQQKQSWRWSILIGCNVPLCLISLHFLTHPHLEKIFFYCAHPERWQQWEWSRSNAVLERNTSLPAWRYNSWRPAQHTLYSSRPRLLLEKEIPITKCKLKQKKPFFSFKLCFPVRW